MMPGGMDGLTLCKAIKGDLALASMRLVLLTAYDSEDQQKLAEKAGFFAYLTKPIKQPELLNVIISSKQDKGQKPTFVVHKTQPILLVEDNATNQKVVTLQLQALGYEVRLASGGLQAIDMLAQGDFSLVLMDCQMPELDGYETTRLIRRIELKTGQHIPIIAVTANAMDGDRETALGAGMDDYITKPVETKQLRIILDYWLSLPNMVEPLEQGQHRLNPAPARPTISAETSTQTLDMDALDRLRSLGKPDEPNFLSQLIDDFFVDTSQLLDSLRHAIDENDAKAIFVAAHSLKSSGATYGAKHFASLCKALESAARDGELSEAASHLNRIEVEYLRVKHALEAEQRRG
jgi:CheY-like chemotaxis protein